MKAIPAFAAMAELRTPARRASVFAAYEIHVRGVVPFQRTSFSRVGRDGTRAPHVACSQPSQSGARGRTAP
jgi:hypothetical protein